MIAFLEGRSSTAAIEAVAAPDDAEGREPYGLVRAARRQSPTRRHPLLGGSARPRPRLFYWVALLGAFSLAIGILLVDLTGCGKKGNPIPPEDVKPERK
jgi:hypothetical protein